jgi:hypothetical protein
VSPIKDLLADQGLVVVNPRSKHDNKSMIGRVGRRRIGGQETRVRNRGARLPLSVGFQSAESRLSAVQPNAAATVMAMKKSRSTSSMMATLRVSFPLRSPVRTGRLN